MLQVLGPCPTVEDLINDENFNPDDYYGFIYCIVNNITGKQYLGKKNFRSTTNKKLGKKELAALPVTRGRTPKKKKIIKNSDWHNYYGSSLELKKDVKELGVDKFTRYVYKLCKTPKQLNYYETKYQFTYEVLEPQNNGKWYNSNIAGRYFPADILEKSE